MEDVYVVLDITTAAKSFRKEITEIIRKIPTKKLHVLGVTSGLCGQYPAKPIHSGPIHEFLPILQSLQFKECHMKPVHISEAIQYIQLKVGTSSGVLFILASGVANLEALDLRSLPSRGLIQLNPFVSHSLGTLFDQQTLSKYHEYACYMSSFWTPPKVEIVDSAYSDTLHRFLARMQDPGADRNGIIQQMLSCLPCSRSFLRAFHFGVCWKGKLQGMNVIIGAPFFPESTVSYDEWPEALTVSSYFDPASQLIQNAIKMGIRAGVYACAEASEAFYGLWKELQSTAAMIKLSGSSAIILIATQMDIVAYIIEKTTK